MDHKFTLGVTNDQIGGPAHPFFVGVLGHQHLAVFPVGLGVLKHHADEAEPKFFGHLAVVVAHAMAGATVF